MGGQRRGKGSGSRVFGVQRRPAVCMGDWLSQGAARSGGNIGRAPVFLETMERPKNFRRALLDWTQCFPSLHYISQGVQEDRKPAAPSQLFSSQPMLFVDTLPWETEAPLNA